MAKVERKKSVKISKKNLVSPFKIYWSPLNYYIFGIGIFLTIVGFYFMSINPWDSTSALFISPIILFITYVVIFPLSILLRKKETDNKQENVSDSR